MFSQACKYSIEAVAYIGTQTIVNRPVSVNEIAEAVDAPKPYMAKILQKLAKNNIITSIRGSYGGYKVENTDLSLYDLVIAIDGDAFFTTCVLGIKQCSNERPCLIHTDFVSIKKEVMISLKQKKIKDVVTDLEIASVFLKS